MHHMMMDLLRTRVMIQVLSAIASVIKLLLLASGFSIRCRGTANVEVQVPFDAHVGLADTRHAKERQ
jgi:hypothetical protein